MPKIYPFQAYRYNLKNSDLKQAVCPPYDVINSALEKKLKADRRNAIHIELPSGNGDAKYENARKVWQRWSREGLVRRDESPSFYVYEQTFAAGGKKYSRRGFFCELEVEKPGEGSVLRHEYTLAGPKQDRLNLIKAVKLNTSPIFGLFRDHAKTIEKALKKAASRNPEVSFQDRDGVAHRLWRLSEPKSVAAVQAVIAKNPVVIADGHHRYETSWNYAQEMKGSLLTGARRTLFFLCSMEDAGLVIFPTHRILLKAEGRGLEELRGVIEQSSIFKAVENGKRFRDIQGERGFSFTVTDGKRSFHVYLKSLPALKKALPGKPDSYLKLPLVHLHRCVLPELQKEDFLYVHDEKEAVDVASENGKLAILVPATSTDELYRVVRAGEVMPQKSTYFYPKVITGLVFRGV